MELKLLTVELRLGWEVLDVDSESWQKWHTTGCLAAGIPQQASNS